MKKLILKTLRAMQSRHSVLGFVLVCKRELQELEGKVETMDLFPDATAILTPAEMAELANCDQLEALLRDSSARLHREAMPEHSAANFNSCMVAAAERIFHTVEEATANAGRDHIPTTQHLTLLVAGQLYFRRAAYTSSHQAKQPTAADAAQKETKS